MRETSQSNLSTTSAEELVQIWNILGCHPVFIDLFHCAAAIETFLCNIIIILESQTSSQGYKGIFKETPNGQIHSQAISTAIPAARSIAATDTTAPFGALLQVLSRRRYPPEPPPPLLAGVQLDVAAGAGEVGVELLPPELATTRPPKGAAGATAESMVWAFFWYVASVWPEEGVDDARHAALAVREGVLGAVEEDRVGGVDCYLEHVGLQGGLSISNWAGVRRGRVKLTFSPELVGMKPE